KSRTPAPASVPVHCTVNVGEVCVAASESTWVAGGSRSIVLSHVGVAIGALVSNTTRAWFWIAVPVANPLLGITVNIMLPSPAGGAVFGGKKPVTGSSVSWPVLGSIEVKRQVTRPVLLSSAA